MFSGEMTSVTLEGRNDLVGVVIDRFGKDISIVPRGEDHFQAQVNVLYQTLQGKKVPYNDVVQG